MEWQPPISEEEAAAERGEMKAKPKAQTVTKSKETYLIEKNQAEMQHYLKHLPAAAKSHLKQVKQQQAQAKQPQTKQPNPDQLETIEVPAIDVLEKELQDPTERNVDLCYDPDQDTPCIKGNQHYFLVSFLRKGINAERDWYRIWCACSGKADLERSKARIREENPYAEWWDIYAMPAGGWCPWPPAEAESQEYANEEMADFMKHHMENLGKALKHDRERKSELMSQEDVNLRVRKEKALKKKHKRWLKKQQEKAAALGIPVEELIEREGRQAQYEAAMGATQPQWDGDLSKDEYELITVQEEETLPDGTVELVEKTIRIKKRTLQQKIQQQQEMKERQLLQQVAELQQRLESVNMFLRQQGVDERSIPTLTMGQLQARTESRDSQAAVALDQQVNAWRQNQINKSKSKS